jgi:GDP-D-mannose dehydratase
LKICFSVHQPTRFDGHARDYAEGMHRILQADAPDNFVLASGETRSIREFVELAFGEIGHRIEWQNGTAKASTKPASTVIRAGLKLNSTARGHADRQSRFWAYPITS